MSPSPAIVDGQDKYEMGTGKEDFFVLPGSLFELMAGNGNATRSETAVINMRCKNARRLEPAK